MTENTSLCSKLVTKDSDPWFSEDANEVAFARGVCKVCPVWATCMTFSLVNGFEYGMFAGLTPEERKPIREKMFRELPAETIAALTDTYFVPDIMEDRSFPSVEAKYRRRRERAEVCHALLMNADPDDIGDHYDMYLACVSAVLDNPAGTGETLGKSIGRSGALFNQRLRECFEYFNMDMSVL